MSENFTNLMKDTCVDSRSPGKSYQDESRDNYTHIAIRLLKTKDEEKNILKAAIPILEIYPREIKTCLNKMYTHMLIAALLVIA